MKMSEEVMELIQKMPYIPLATQGKEGPHLIVVDKGFVINANTVAFFGWKHGRTSENIRNTGAIQIVVVSEDKKKGIRVKGKANIEEGGEAYAKLAEQFQSQLDKQLGRFSFVIIMKVQGVESLL